MKENISYIALASLIVAIIVLLFGNNLIGRFFGEPRNDQQEKIETPLKKEDVQQEKSDKNERVENYQSKQQAEKLSKEENRQTENIIKKLDENVITQMPSINEDNIIPSESNDIKTVQKTDNVKVTNNCLYQIDSRTATNIPIFRAPNKNSEIKFKLPHAQNVFIVDSMVYGNNDVYYHISLDKKTGWVRKKNIKTNCK